MKRNRNFKGLLLAMVLICGVVSCATGTVYLKDVNKYTSSAFKVEYDWDYYNLLWDQYKLARNSKTKEKKVDFKKYGMDGYDRKSGYITNFSKSKKFLYEVTILSGLKKLSAESIYKDESESYIVIDKTKIKVNFSDDTVIAEDSSFMPVKVLAINHFERDGKVYSMPGHEKAGAKITLYNQEYAVIDFISENPTILLNSKFLRELTVEETDFAAALMLGLYEMNQTTED